ncbi:hypothetical protein J4481_01115 [Candidatus Pacearchaeota archaeon]|nr:hypothetical protein [uncultured archaeon]MBS3076324.1 hypothetical protein [Candidatus Pacearchaeota archaeon]
MTNKIQELEQKLNEQKNKFGLVGAKPARVQEFDDAENNFSAHINPYDWGIEVTLKTGYNPIQDLRQERYAKLKKIKDPLETLVLQVGSGHEVAHWELPFGSGKGCPFDTYNHDKIVEGIKKGLPKNKQQFASYLANAFEDTLINPRVKEYFGDFSGTILFWDGEGQRTQEETGKKGFTPLYEAFVKVNLHLFGDRLDKIFLRRNFTNNEKVDKAVNEVIKNLNLEEGINDTTPLFNKSQWPRMAEQYARAMSNLLDEMPQERMSAYDSGQGSPEDSKEKKSGNGVEEKSKSNEGKEEIVYGRYKAGETQSPNIESFEQLDTLYQKLAQDIPVKVEAITRESSMEISPLNYRPFDEETDNPLKIKTSKFFFDENGFNFAYPNQPLTIDYKQKVQRKAFPNLSLIWLDASGSMASGINGDSGSKIFIPYGDKSKYHFGVLGCYGIENFLIKQGIAPYIEFGMALFSGETRFKKGDYNDLPKIRKFRLNPDWNVTNLDASVLKQALSGEGDFALSISDGDVSNWDSEKEEIKKLIEQNYYAHIQLGSGTSMTEDLKYWGMPVFYVNSGEDLTKLMVDITKNTYHPFVQEANK